MITAADRADGLATPSTTGRTLRRLRAVLVAGSLLAGALSLLTFGRAHAAVDAIRTRNAPAVLEAHAAYRALADAQHIAVAGIRTGTAALSGPGAQYENDISAVDQSLEQLAAWNVADTAKSSELHLIEGEVVSYNAQIGQAEADYQRQGKATGLVFTDLWNASTTVGTALDDLRALQVKEQSALTARRSSTWLAADANLVWLLPTLLVLALLGVVHGLVYRRFRRRLSTRLVGAVLALVTMSLLCGPSLLAAGSELDAALRGPFTSMVHLTQQQESAIRSTSQADLFTLNNLVCSDSGHCGTHLTAPQDPSTTELDRSSPSRNPTTYRSSFDRKIAAADAGYLPRAVLIGGSAIVAAALTAFGLRPRINEYRFGV